MAELKCSPLILLKISIVSIVFIVRNLEMLPLRISVGFLCPDVT